MFFLKGSWPKEMTTPRNDTPNSSFFLLNVRVQASRGLSLGCALLMPNTIWRVTTRISLIWLVEAIFRRGTNQRVLLLLRRRTQSIPPLPSMLRRFLPDSSHSFGWSHICAVFVAILNFTLWGNTHSSIHCHVLLQSKVWRGSGLRQRLSEAVENWSDIRRKFKFKV